MHDDEDGYRLLDTAQRQSSLLELRHSINKFFSSQPSLPQSANVTHGWPRNQEGGLDYERLVLRVAMEPTFVVREDGGAAGGDEEREGAGHDDEVGLGGLRLPRLEHLEIKQGTNG